MPKKVKFKKHNVNAKPDVVETPYTRARAEWDDRIGNARVQARNWRLVAILSLLVSAVIVALLIIFLSIDHTKIYVAQVTKAGRVVNVAPLSKPYQPTDAQKEYFISEFIKKVRSLPLDPVVAQQNWQSAYNYLTQAGAKQLDAVMAKMQPQKLLGKEAITVKINDINALSPNTFQVDWTETVFSKQGEQSEVRKFSGVFTVAVSQPKTQAQMLANPLGIYIKHFDVNRRES